MDLDEINTEKRHLSRLPWSPFLVGAITEVSDSTNVSLVLELMPHGNLYQLIDRFGPFNQLVACFYYCNIICAIEFIHSHGLVSRDIKPANFLVGHDGYLVMTDLGISEVVGEGRSWQGQGTSYYMAPELIEAGYETGKTVDWWASGVVLYAMLTQTLVCFIIQSRHPRPCCRIRGNCLLNATYVFLCLAVPGKHRSVDIQQHLDVELPVAGGPGLGEQPQAHNLAAVRVRPKTSARILRH